MFPKINPAEEVVLDIETLGVIPGCVILSIGACTVDGYNPFYRGVIKWDSFNVGLTANESTVDWWDSQSKENPEAFKAAMTGSSSLKSALTEFSYWYTDLIGATAIWGNGSDFDMPILAAAYKACGIQVPWTYRHARCFRTMRALYPQIAAPDFVGIKHHALDDAINEAAHLRKILQEINNAA